MSAEALERAAWEDATAPGAILLVSDRPAGSSDLRLLLERHGYEVAVAPSIADALRVLSDVQPDLVMVDVDLRDGEPLAFAAAVREDFPDIALVMIAPQRREILERVRTALVSDVLPCPPGHEDTLRLVGRLMLERLGPFRDLSRAPRRAEEIETWTEFPTRVRIARHSMNAAPAESLRRDLSRRGIPYREVREPWSADRDDAVLEFRVTVRQALELGWHPVEIRSALADAFPWLGTDARAVDHRLRALCGPSGARKVG